MSRISLKVRAGARKTEFTGRLGGVWKLAVAAPPLDGKANDEIIRFLAKLTRVPKGSIRIVTGQTSTAKLIEVEGVENETLERVILESNGSGSHSGSSAPRKA
jgi:hypothetical protein